MSPLRRSTPILPLPAVVVDVETTGSHKAGRVIQVGAVVLTEAGPVSPRGFLVHPGEGALKAALPFAMRIHGISYNQIRREGIPAEKAAGRFRGWLARARDQYAPGQSIPLLAHGASHEWKYFSRPLWGLDAPDSPVSRGPCVLEAARRWMPAGLRHNLSAVSAWAVGAGYPAAAFSGAGAHDALEDARVTAWAVLALRAEAARQLAALAPADPALPAAGVLVVTTGAFGFYDGPVLREIPAGTQGRLLGPGDLGRLADRDRADAADLLKRRRKKRGEKGGPVWIAGQVRWLAPGDFRSVGSP